MKKIFMFLLLILVPVSACYGAYILYEEFEANPGYDDPPWVDVSRGSNIVDPDCLVSGIPGSPAAWGTQCLHMTSTNLGNWAGIQADVSASKVDVTFDIMYHDVWRQDTGGFARLGADSSPGWCWSWYPENTWTANPASLSSHLLIYKDGATATTHDSITDLNIDTVHTIRIVFDTSSKVYSWYIDGVLQAQGVLTTPDNPTVLELSTAYDKADVYYDNVYVEDLATKRSASLKIDSKKKKHF